MAVQPGLTFNADEELVLYRVAQEALTNVARHSGAKRAEVRLALHSGRPRLEVDDDGTGLPHDAREGSGVLGMRERAVLARRHAEAEPSPLGGARVTLELPRTMNAPRTRIMLADDHAVVRRGLRLVLEGEHDLRVVAEVGDGAEAVERGLQDDVDLAVLDISMPRMTGLQAARELTNRRDGLRVLILSMHDNEQYLFEALRAGASGYVLKSVADRDLVEACRATMRGEPFLYPGAVRALMRDFVERARRGETPPDDPLTPREVEIVKLIAEARTTREIAGELVLSEKTVERHRTNILSKLGMRDRVELVRYAIRRGLVEP